MDFVPSLSLLLKCPTYDDHQCCWKSTKTSSKCQRPISGANHAIVNQIVQRFHSGKTRVSKKELLQELDTLSSLIICQNRYHQRHKDLALQDWIADLERLGPLASCLSKASVESPQSPESSQPSNSSQSELETSTTRTDASTGVSSVQSGSTAEVKLHSMRKLQTIFGWSVDTKSGCIHTRDGVRCQHTISQVFSDRAAQIFEVLVAQSPTFADAEDLLDELALVTHCKQRHRAAGFDRAAQWLTILRDHATTIVGEPNMPVRIPTQLSSEGQMEDPEPFEGESTINFGIRRRATDFLPAEALATTIPEPKDESDLVSFDSLDPKAIRDNTKTNCIAICASDASAGQRCWKKLSKQCRNAAANLVSIIRSQHQQGTIDDEDLTELANNLLCTKAKHHRKQARETAYRWIDELSASLEDDSEEELERETDEETSSLDKISTQESTAIEASDPEDQSLASSSYQSYSSQLSQTEHEPATPSPRFRGRTETPQSTVSTVFTPIVDSGTSTPATSPSSRIRTRVSREDASPSRQAAERRSKRTPARTEGGESLKTEPRRDAEVQETGLSSDVTPEVQTKSRRRSAGRLTRTPDAHRACSLPFYPFWNAKSLFLDYRKNIVGELNQPLVKEEEGYVYVFSRENSPGLLKIGRTSRLVSKRVREQEIKCHYKANIIEDPRQRKSAWHCKLEALVHADLAKFRRKETTCNSGKGCRPTKHCEPTKHDEWFEVGVEQALKTIEKWRLWLEKEPYCTETRYLKEHWKPIVTAIEYCEDSGFRLSLIDESEVPRRETTTEDVRHTQDVVQEIDDAIQHREQASEAERQVIKDVVDALEEDVVAMEESGQLAGAASNVVAPVETLAAGSLGAGALTASTVQVPAG